MKTTDGKITYLFGAGASCNVLPVVKDFPKQLAMLQQDLGNLHNNDTELINRIVVDLGWLRKSAIENESVDVFGRNLYLQSVKNIELLRTNSALKKVDKSIEYRRLKDILNIFFLIKQYTDKADSRYLPFLNKILGKKGEHQFGIPDGLTILNWNYDHQFEIALSEYYKYSSMKDLSAILNCYPCPYTMGALFYCSNHDFNPKKIKPSLIHINGKSGLVNGSKGGMEIIDIINMSSLEDVLQSCMSVYESEKSFLYFSWEKGIIAERAIEYAKEAARDTEVLVIIGYSFPVINKSVDSSIIQTMSKSLKKIYVLDPAPSLVAKDLKRYFSLNELVIVHYYNKKEEYSTFHVPYEFGY